MVVKEPRKAAPRPRRGRTETQTELAAIKREIEVSQEEADSRTDELIRLREDSIRQAVKDVGVETVVQNISGLGLEVSRSLARLSEKLTEEVTLLATVQEAVALERAELERLHKIDVAATALAQLVQDHAREKERLDAEMSAQRKAWQDESARSERERKEQDEALKKQRQREIDEYDYRKTLERKKAQDNYDEDNRIRDKKNHEKQEALEKSWQAREAELKEQEGELARLRREVEAFPALLQKDVDAATQAARKEAEGQFEHQIVLIKKEAEAEKRLAELRVQTLEEALVRSTSQIATLERQLGEAKQQVQDIAVKAIEGASGSQALSHINKIAMEQAKNRPPG